MCKILVITGDLASGKSTFARAIGRRSGVGVYTKDDIKEILADNVGFATREENLRLSHAAVDTMLYFLRSSAAALKGMVLEANFRTSELGEIADIAKSAGCDVLLLRLSGDPDILYQRYINRIVNQSRHPAHQSADLSDPEDFREYVLSNRPEACGIECIDLCADTFDYQNDPALLRRLDEFLGITDALEMKE